MPRFAGSDPALAAAVALSVCPGGLTLSRLARSVAVRTSTMQRAIELLSIDGVVERIGDRYRVTDTPRSRTAVDVGMAYLSGEMLARALASNPAVASAGHDPQGTILVARRFADPIAAARLGHAAQRAQALRPDVGVAVIPHHEVRQRLVADPSMAERMRAMTWVLGDAGRFMPPKQVGRAVGRVAQGHLDPGVVQPSQRALQAFATAHGLRRVTAFGSAVRDDFGPSSDIDLLVEPTGGARLSLLELSAMTADAEDLFDREVDIVVGPLGDPRLSADMGREGIVLYDAH